MNENIQLIRRKIEQWKLIRELRNAVNHEYEENSERLSEFFQELAQADHTQSLV